MKWALLVMMGMFVGLSMGCGYPPPQEIRPGVYELQYCDDEVKCFEAAKKVCPDGFRITKYGALRPEEFTCT